MASHARGNKNQRIQGEQLAIEQHARKNTDAERLRTPIQYGAERRGIIKQTSTDEREPMPERRTQERRSSGTAPAPPRTQSPTAQNGRTSKSPREDHQAKRQDEERKEQLNNDPHPPEKSHMRRCRQKQENAAMDEQEKEEQKPKRQHG